MLTAIAYRKLKAVDRRYAAIIIEQEINKTTPLITTSTSIISEATPLQLYAPAPSGGVAVTMLLMII